jgi:glycerol uptake facilitator-like aquaporin
VVGAYIGAAYWFTSSTSFANPTVTLGRAFTDTFAGVNPTSVPGFILAQLGGLLLGVALLLTLYPHVGQAADQVLVAHTPAGKPPPAVPAGHPETEGREQQ